MTATFVTSRKKTLTQTVMDRRALWSIWVKVTFTVLPPKKITLITFKDLVEKQKGNNIYHSPITTQPFVALESITIWPLTSRRHIETPDGPILWCH